MRGDFTRDSFDPYQHYTRVLMQQGRVQLDADWNEQVAIIHHYLRTLAADVIGPFGGPANDCGFGVVTDPAQVEAMPDRYGLPLDPQRLEELKRRLAGGDFVIGPGRYYVDGLLCENDEPVTFGEQLGYPFDGQTTLEALRGAGPFLLYLDVWERHVSCLEAADLLEVALGGPDTATRAQLVWQVKALRAPAPVTCASHGGLRRPRPPLLRARATRPQEQQDACVIDPAARYRGPENQLYRVEIHRGGPARRPGDTAGGATFKWSRENGSVAFPVTNLAEDTQAGETTVRLATLGRDRRLGLTQGTWVEVVDDGYTLRGGAEPLHQVERIDHDELEVTLSGVGPGKTGQDQGRHPLLRRWDHDASDPATSYEGALLVPEAAADSGWVELEDGVLVQFPASPDPAQPNEYRAGDYWVVPARTATGDVVWPRRRVGDELEPLPRPPRGVEHHYAPLAIATIDGNGRLTVQTPDCRQRFDPLPAAKSS
jgi:hypothetical protein